MKLPFLLERAKRRLRKGRNSTVTRSRTEIDLGFLAPVVAMLAVGFVIWVMVGWIGETARTTRYNDDQRCVKAYGEGWDHRNEDVEKIERKGNKLPESVTSDNDIDAYAACVKGEEIKLVPVD